jgi:hypothetical protein
MRPRPARSAFLVGLSAALLAAPVARAATPPALVNYQGVLRDAANKPLSGSFDMTFGFWSAPTGGDEVLRDGHTISDAVGPVVVSNGLFNVALGSGGMSDGPGPETYLTLAALFRDYPTVYLEIKVGAETLAPRVQLLSAAYAQNATHLDGRGAAEFLDTGAAQQTKAGRLRLTPSETTSGYGLYVKGLSTASVFAESSSSGKGYLAYADTGVYGEGGSGGFGSGGYFRALDGNGFLLAGTGNNGLKAGGTGVPGDFQNSFGPSKAFLAASDYAVRAEGGSSAAGYFVGTGSASVSVGMPDTGISARGDIAGVFQHTGLTGYARLAYRDEGILARGRFPANAGNFEDTLYSGRASLAPGDTGVTGQGSYQGAEFTDTNDGNYARVGYSGYKIYGNGAMGFVQNHPGDPTKAIVYTAPEGDETAVYTRGSAQLVGGEARVALGPTFQLVANPELGLTAHLTPRGDCNGLYVEALSPTELVVRERGGGTSDAAFDYLVYGLRIGFEERAVVRERTTDSPIPAMLEDRAELARQPALRAFTARERFRAMPAVEPRHQPAAGDGAAGSAPGLAEALIAAIGHFDPARAGAVAATPLDPLRGGAVEAALPGKTRTDARDPGPAERAGTPYRAEALDAAAPPAPLLAQPLPITETVESGDLLALASGAAPGLARSAVAQDPLVVGIAAGDPGQVWRGTAPVALAGTVVSCRADATAAPIAAGDLLVSSALPGHAMKAPEGAAPGTIVAKALEPLAAGTGLIRVLVMAR